MHRRTGVAIASAILLFPLLAFGQKDSAATGDDQNALVITFNDGHQKTYSMADIARIEVTTAKATVAAKGVNRFLGKWRVGDGNGKTFYITLEREGIAEKTLGASHGTWIIVDNQARITWDDGWHDAIRKTGSQFEKAAFAPGKAFTDQPDNVTKAENTAAQPL